MCGTLRLFFLAALAVSASACSPRLDRPLAPPVVAVPSTRDMTGMFAGPLRAHIQSVRDDRPEATLVEINGRVINSSGEFTAQIGEVLEEGLRNSGVEIDPIDTPALRGSVREWKALVAERFPVSSIEAVARIRISVVDVKGRPRYTADYTGTSTSSTPLVSEGRVRTSLADAMSEALGEAFRDERLMQRLTY